MQDVKKGLERAKACTPCRDLRGKILALKILSENRQNISTLGVLKIAIAQIFSWLCSSPLSIELKLILSYTHNIIHLNKEKSFKQLKFHFMYFHLRISSKPSYHCFPKKSRNFWFHLRADGIWQSSPHKRIRLLPNSICSTLQSPPLIFYKPSGVSHIKTQVFADICAYNPSLLFLLIFINLDLVEL